MMHLLRKYDVAPLRSAMMRCLPQNVAKPRIIREANIIRRSRHHLPKANIIQKKNICLPRQMFFFCWWGKLGIAMRSSFVGVGALCARQALCAALRKIPRSLCSSRLLCDGGMRHSVRCCRPGFATKQKTGHKGRFIFLIEANLRYNSDREAGYCYADKLCGGWRSLC